MHPFPHDALVVTRFTRFAVSIAPFRGGRLHEQAHRCNRAEIPQPYRHRNAPLAGIVAPIASCAMPTEFAQHLSCSLLEYGGMANVPDNRQGPERRRHPRGGRRTTDVSGWSPLVLVVDPDPGRREISEAILARLRFAVAPVESAEKAVSLIQALRPEIIVAGEDDARHIRALASSSSVPVVSFGEQSRATEELIETVRRALRARVSQT